MQVSTAVGHSVVTFLTHLTVNGNVAASTQTQALSALLFLYRYVLKQPLSATIQAVRAKQIIVRDTKGNRDRITLLPQQISDPQTLNRNSMTSPSLTT